MENQGRALAPRGRALATDGDLGLIPVVQLPTRRLSGLPQRQLFCYRLRLACGGQGRTDSSEETDIQISLGARLGDSVRDDCFV